MTGKIKKLIIGLTMIGAVFGVIQLGYAGDRLLATGGVSQIEGSGGGGLVPWAFISGYGTQDQIGGGIFYTQSRTNGGFDLSSVGVNVGFYNRVELALSQQKFGLSDTVPGETIHVNTFGIKVRLIGDAVYDQDTWIPQVSLGLNIKHNEDFNFVPKLLGAKQSSGVDAYLAASKLYLGAVLGRNLLLSGSLLATKSNQFGILGFGGDKQDHSQLMPAFSAGLMLTDSLVAGVEYRAKPNNLSVFKEDDAKDLFVAWFPLRNVAITAAFIDLGNIANKDNQTGWYLSGQLSY